MNHDFPAPDQMPVPTCACSQQMTRQTWTEPTPQGPEREITGFACSTDGCEGNFPQRWQETMERMHGKAEAR